MNCLLLILLAAGQPSPELACLTAAYPDFLYPAARPDAIAWKDGSEMPYTGAGNGLTFEERCERAGLADQMSIPYPAGWPVAVPEKDADPGRLRHEPFFRKMYGGDRKSVEANLVRVAWGPAKGNKSVLFSKVNGAADALKAVSDELSRMPQSVRAYAAEPAGTFVWRKIAGTERLSMHALAVAIDFHLPKPLGRYWRWDHADVSQPCTYPAPLLQDENLGRLVRVFERHGFIWGGKWHHYDSIHFEYRPELINSRQLAAVRPVSHPRVCS